MELTNTKREKKRQNVGEV